MTSIFGKCLCGEVEFEIAGTLPQLYQCHCSLCQKQGGSTSNTAMIVRAEQLRWLSGQQIISSFVKPTGFRSDFCSRCGSPVPNPLRDAPYYWVPAGLFGADVDLKVVAHLFVRSKASWDVIGGDGTLFQTMPPIADLLHLLHSAD